MPAHSDDQRMPHHLSEASAKVAWQPSFAARRQHVGAWDWTEQTGWYLAYRLADFVVLNLGDDVAMVAFMFC